MMMIEEVSDRHTHARSHMGGLGLRLGSKLAVATMS